MVPVILSAVPFPIAPQTASAPPVVNCSAMDCTQFDGAVQSESINRTISDDVDFKPTFRAIPQE